MTLLVVRNTMVAGDVTDASKVSENFHDVGLDTVGDIVNGFLDKTNVTTVKREFFRPQTLVRLAARAGGTNALDYFSEVFGGSEGSDTENSNVPGDEEFIAVPGLSVRYYLNFVPTAVLLLWQVNWGNDGRLYRSATAGVTTARGTADGATGSSTMQLFSDGVSVAGVKRHLPGQVLQSIDPLGWLGSNDARRFARGGHLHNNWSGSYTLQGAAIGWHTAGIRLLASKNTRTKGIAQTRVRARNFRVIVFK